MSSSVPFAPPGLKLRRPRTVAEVSLVIYQLYNACLFAHLQHFNAQGARLPPCLASCQQTRQLADREMASDTRENRPN
jgi:hypothetical protein